MSLRKKTGLAVAIAALVAPVALTVGTATPAAAYASCGTTVADKDGSGWDPTADGANQRSGPSTSCAITGFAGPSDKLDYHCYTNAGSYTWTYLRNDTDNTYGWVRDDLLSDSGSFQPCGL